MQAGHFYPQGSKKSVMYDPRNVHAQCVGCNKWKHGNLTVYAEALIDKYGLQEFKELARLSRVSRPWSRPEREKLLKALRERPQDYEKEYYKIA